MQENYEIFKDLIQTVGLLYLFNVCSGDIYIKKTTSENDQLTGHFQSIFFPSTDPKSEKKSHKPTNKKKSGLT